MIVIIKLDIAETILYEFAKYEISFFMLFLLYLAIYLL